MIELIQATKTYESGGATIQAVAGVSLTLPDGDFIAIVGHSGSGKTTLVSLMGGLTRPTAGRVLIDGADIWSIEAEALAHLRGERIGFCFQFASLIPTLNCLDNVRLPVAFASGGKGGSGRAMKLLETVGVADKARAYPAELSGGQQRRVAIARALVNEPRIILADEPTGDLDEATEADIMDLFQEVNSRGATVVMVTHSTRLANHASRIYTMADGALVGQEPDTAKP
ncbi:MAG: ABC transporter ATP-binding protein [Thermoleophilia bacterium]